MSKKLDRGSISAAAIRLIDERGFDSFSLTALAKELGVKTASLYNHISGLEDLLAEVSAAAAEMMNRAAEVEMAGKQREAALKALAFSLWDYAKRHTGLYHLMVRSTMDESHPEMKHESIRVLEPITAALDGYRLTEEQRVHWHRIIRSVGYGFVLHELGGAFCMKKYGSETTYAVICESIHRSLCELESINEKSEGKES